MRKHGRKLLLSSLILMVGVSSASSGFLTDFQKASENIGELRGTIGMESWETPKTSRFSKANPMKIVSGDVYLPNAIQIAELANSNLAFDDQGNQLDMVATGSVGESAEVEIIWERFNSKGHHLREKFVK